MNNNLKYTEAEELLGQGKFVALPGWGGFWFRMPEGIRALTVPSTVAKAWTDKPEITDRNDWQEVPGEMDFGTALTVLKAGFAIRAEGWPLDHYVFIRPADTLDRTVVGIVKSLPAVVKAFMHRQYKAVHFTPYFCKATSDTILNGWLPSTEELIFTRWVIATNIR